MAKKKITEVLQDYFDGEFRDGEYILYDSEFLKEGSDYYLRIYIDRKDGEYIGTDDCEKVSNRVSQYLDEVDPIEQNYYLEVSSPGMDRALTRPEHFDRYRGQNVDVSLYKKIDGEKVITGELISFEDGRITLRISENREIILDQKDVAKVNLSVDWR